MTDETSTIDPLAPDALRDDDGRLRGDWIERLKAEIEAGNGGVVTAIIAPLHAADVGDVLEALDRDERLALIHLLGDGFDFSALTEIDENIRKELIDQIPNAAIARGVSDLDNDDAVSILEDLDAPDREEVLEQLPAFERLSLRRSLDFPPIPPGG